MNKYLSLAALLASIFLVGSVGFSNKSSTRGYGFASVVVLSDSVYRYRVIDLDVLDSMKINYSCVIGGRYCQVRVKIDRKKITRKGLYGEIIEFDSPPSKLAVSGEGFHFSYY